MGFSAAVDSYFKVSERGSTIADEIKSGVVTFLTMSYILLVNPQILGAAGIPVTAVVTATALSSVVACLICGVGANVPVGLSPGMGLNAYLVFSQAAFMQGIWCRLTNTLGIVCRVNRAQVLGLGVSVNKALAGCLVAAGLVALLAVIRVLSIILGVVPDSIKLAVVVGMGLLLTFIGMQTSKIVVADAETMVTMGDLFGVEPMLAIGGLAIIAALHFRNVKGSILVGVLITALAFFALSNSWPTSFLALPHLKIFELDFSDLFSKKPQLTAWSAVLAYSLVMIFDIGGAMFGLGNLAGLATDGHVPGTVVTYLAAAAGTAIGAFTGTTPLIIAAESAVGIKEGGRTGLVSLTVAGCFLVSMFLAPFMQAIPQVATAPVLVLVGAMMMGESTHIDWSNMLTAIPAFLTIVIQPFTFSIANGIYAGLVMCLLLYVLTGQWLELFSPASKEGYEQDDEVGDLETPLVNGRHEGDSTASLGALPPIAASHHQLAQEAIPIGLVRRTSGTTAGTPPAGSYRGRGTPYERGSFTMYINTFGSHTSPAHRGFLGGAAQGSEDPEQ